MKEFKYCHEEITMGVEIPVTVCETQKEMVNEISEVREVSFNDYIYEEVELIEFNRQCAIKERKEHGYSAWFYDEQIRSVIGTSDETSIYIIYKDGSKYFETFGERQGKFKRYGIKAAVIETAYEYTVFGDFAVTDNGDISIEENDIEEYGIYAGQYDVKEQEVQEVQETVAQTVETIAEGTSEVETTEQAQAEENKDTFEYRNYIISGNERTGIIAIDNHGNFSPKVYKTVEEAKKAVDEDIEYAEKKYAEMEAEQTEVEETAETETEETIKTTAEQETAETGEGISKTETTTGTDDSGFEYTRSQAQEIIMAGTSIAREKYREKHGIYSPMDLKKFSRKQLDDYLSKEIDYINKFLNDTLPKEIFNAMKGEIMYA